MADVRQGTGEVTGNVAHDDVDVGNPLKVGQRAVSVATVPSTVASGDRTDWIADRNGVPFVVGGHPNVERLSVKNQDAVANQVLRAVAPGERFVVTAVSAYVDGGNRPPILVHLGALRVAEHPGPTNGGGFSEGNGGGILSIGSPGDDLMVTHDNPGAGSSSVVVHVSGYVVPS